MVIADDARDGLPQIIGKNTGCPERPIRATEDKVVQRPHLKPRFRRNYVTLSKSTHPGI